MVGPEPPPELLQRLEKGCVIISLFGGIEAGRRACDLLGVPLTRHIAVEIGKNAIRAVAEVYPEVIHFGDVTEFDRSAIHGALTGIQVLFALLIAGVPCQGLSGANATKKGFYDPRSQLFFEALRIVKDLQSEKTSIRISFRERRVYGRPGSRFGVSLFGGETHSGLLIWFVTGQAATVPVGNMADPA